MNQQEPSANSDAFPPGYCTCSRQKAKSGIPVNHKQSKNIPDIRVENTVHQGMLPQCNDKSSQNQMFNQAQFIPPRQTINTNNIYLDSVNSIVPALAWPITTIILARLLKNEIQQLLSRMRKAKVWNTELEFGEVIQKLKIAGEIPTPPSNEIYKSMQKAALPNPRSAIISAWETIENEIFNVAKRRAIEMAEGKPSVASAIKAIQSLKLLDQSMINIFHDLRSLRNQAAHDVDFYPPEEYVYDYLLLTDKLRTALINIPGFDPMQTMFYDNKPDYDE